MTSNQQNVVSWTGYPSIRGAADRRLMNRTEVAEILGISERKLWSMTHERSIPCVRIGRRVLYDSGDLWRWIDGLKG